MTDGKGGIPESEPSGTDSGENFEVVLDEDFIRAAPAKEASARARELSARWAQQPPEPTGWRTDGPPTGLRPDPAPSGPGAAEKPGRRERRRREKQLRRAQKAPAKAQQGAYDVGRSSRRVWPRNLAIALVAAALVGFALYPRHPADLPLNATPAGTGEPAASAPTGSDTPSPSPSPSASFANPDDEYFVGSPSLQWADNGAGITPPAAAAVGDYGADQVAAAYQQMVQLLTAGNLDNTILDGGPLTDFTGLVDPVESALLTRIAQSVTAPSYQNSATNYVTRFNPATTRLLGHTVKVSGTISAAIGDQGALVVTGDYRFVYALGAADGGGSPTRSVVHRVYQTSVFPAGYGVTPGTIWISNYNVDIANDACFKYDGYINPQFGDGDGGGAGGVNSTKLIDPYASQNLLASPTSSTPVPTGSPTECDEVSRL